MRKNLFWLSDEQWARIEPHLPTDVRGVERVDDRRVISGIVHVLKSGCRWCDCPLEYGPSTTIYNRFVRWARRGLWEKLFRELAGDCHIFPFLYAVEGRRLLMGAMGRGKADAPPEGDVRAPAMPVLQRHLQGLSVTTVDVETLRVRLEHRYDRLFPTT